MRRITVCMLFVLWWLPAASQAQYLEGVEYTQIKPQPVETGDKIEVREIFWYGCPHCYALEPVLTRWLKTLPRNAQFVRTPGVFRDTWLPHARAFYAFEALGVTPKVHAAMFEAIHAQHRSLNDPASIADFVAAHGVGRQAFVDAYNSFGVEASVRGAMQRVQRYGINSVPTIVVDGKYVTTGNLTGGHEQLMQVVDFLVKKAAQERKGVRAR